MRSVNPGDHVEVNIRGNVFNATVTEKIKYHGVRILPDEPKRITWRFVKPRLIVKKLESGVEG